MPDCMVAFNEAEDEEVLQKLAACLRSNDARARELRDFVEDLRSQRPQGLQFEPRAGQILVCRFGLGFQKPEIVKTRPVVVVSPKQRRWNGLVMVVPISSTPPEPVEAYHHEIDPAIIPNSKYDTAWIKGDLVMTVSKARLDRLKVGFRRYETPHIGDENLRAVRRCILHSAGMHSLTDAW